MKRWLLLIMLLPALCFAAEDKAPYYEQIYNDLPKEMTELQFGEAAKKYEGKLFEDTGKVVSVKPHQTNQDLALVAFDTDAFDANSSKKFFPDITVAYLKKDAIYLSTGDIKTIRGTIFKIVNIGGAHLIINDATITDK
jgi:hypothetical protein